MPTSSYGSPRLDVLKVARCVPSVSGGAEWLITNAMKSAGDARLGVVLSERPNHPRALSHADVWSIIAERSPNVGWSWPSQSGLKMHFANGAECTFTVLADAAHPLFLESCKRLARTRLSHLWLYEPSAWSDPDNVALWSAILTACKRPMTHGRIAVTDTISTKL